MLAVAAVAAVTGCATQPPLEEYAAPAGLCCASVSALPFRTMPLGQDLEISITPETPTLEFAGRRQHVAALKVPDGFAATTLLTTTYLSGILVWSMSALLPEFVFLDERYGVIATRPAEGFQRTSRGMSGRVAVPGGTRYVLVKAADGNAGVPVVHSGNGTSHRVNPAPVGDFSLRIFGEQK